MRVRSIVAATALVAGMTSNLVYGATYEFIGSISNVNNMPGVNLGDAFTGSMTIDPTTPTSGSLQPNGPGVEQDYASTPTTTNSLQFTVDGTTYSAPSPDISLAVGDVPAGPNQDFFAIGTASVSLGLYSDNGLPFSSTALPTSLNLADFDYFHQIGFSDENQSVITGFAGNITALQQVPEPSTLALLGLASLGLLVRRRFGQRVNRL